jgi:hypothetical protein
MKVYNNKHSPRGTAFGEREKYGGSPLQPWGTGGPAPKVFHETCGHWGSRFKDEMLISNSKESVIVYNETPNPATGYAI